MAVSIFRKTARHGGSYLGMQVVLRLVGIISFPIVTRLLTVHEYGLLALINTTLLFMGALGKCGISNAIITNYSESRLASSRKLYWNGIVTVIGSTAILCALYLMLLYILRHFFYIPSVFYIIVPVIFIRNLLTIHQSWLRAREKIFIHNLLLISFTISSTVISVAALFYIAPTVNAMFCAKVLTETTIGSLVLIIHFLRSRQFWDFFDIVSVNKLLKFGLPLVWVEISMILMTFGDRYQISYLLDAGAVGVYSAAYNLAQYVQQMVSQPMIMAVYPIYNKLYSERGKEETRVFLNRIIRYYFVVTMPAFIFISFYSKPILTILASEKYSVAASIVPVVLLGNILNGCIPIISAGLYVSKNTKSIGRITILCSLINFILNWVFIPLFGYSGAAYTTLISFLILFFLVKKSANKVINIDTFSFDRVRFLLVAMLALFVSFSFEKTSLYGIIASGAVFFIFYFVGILLVDREIVFFIKKIFIKA